MREPICPFGSLVSAKTFKVKFQVVSFAKKTYLVRERNHAFMSSTTSDAVIDKIKDIFGSTRRNCEW